MFETEKLIPKEVEEKIPYTSLPLFLQNFHQFLPPCRGVSFRARHFLLNMAQACSLLILPQKSCITSVVASSGVRTAGTIL